MIKNIILFFLAICFILLIISYISEFNFSIIEGNGGIDQTIANASIIKIDPEEVDELEALLNLHENNSGVIPSNNIEMIMKLSITDPDFLKIVKDENRNDVTKLNDLRKYLQNNLKPRLSSDGLILHYALDDMAGGTVKNIAAETMGNPKYDGKVNGAVSIDSSDHKYGKGSMRFKYNSSQRGGNQTDYITIPSIPNTFYGEGDIFKGFTFATWYKTTPNSKPWARLFEFAAGGGGNHTILASVNFGDQSNYTFLVHGENAYEFNVSMTQQQFETDQWIHVATTISPNGTYTNYINGIITPSNYGTFKTDGTQAPPDTNTNSVVWFVDPDTKGKKVPTNRERTVNYIGKSAWWNWDGGFDGRMNDFRIYRRSLSIDEITNIYNLKNPDRPFSFTNLKIHINAKKDSIIQQNRKITFRDKSGNNNMGSTSNGIEYCPTNQVITIPSGQHLEIKNTGIANDKFTIGIVVNMKNFNPSTHKTLNYLFGSSLTVAFVMFIHNNTLYVGTSAVSALSYNLSNFNANAVNIFIVKLDANQNISISINGKPCISSQPFVHTPWRSKNIYIGRDSSDYWSSDAIDFYEFMYISEFYDNAQQANLEGYLANNWGLMDSLPIEHLSRKKDM